MAQIASIAAHAETARTAPVPRAPATLEETGLSVDQIRQLFVKALYTGEATGITLSERLRLPYTVLEPIVEHIVRIERLVEVKGATGTGAAGYRYALTDLGRDRAKQYLEANQYVGPAPVPLAVVPPAAPEGNSRPANVVEFKSPLVGTFYISPKPDADPFVKAGDEVGPEKVICIIEAMKVMNEIKAEMSGVVREVLVKNSQAVEFGEPLFLIEKE